MDVAVDRGRAPIGPDEIALGPAELDALGVSIGDTVEVAVPEFSDATFTDAVTATVTGRAIVAAPIYESLEPGEGGAVTVGLMRRIVGDDMPVNQFFVAPMTALRSGTGPKRCLIGSLLRSGSPAPTAPVSARYATSASFRSYSWRCWVRWQPQPSFTGSSRVPCALRRDLAVLRSMGFTDSQFVQSGGAQGAAVSALALVGAIPAGLILAAVSWRMIAEYLVVVPQPIVPSGVVTVVVAATLVLGTAVGIVLALRARRVRVGDLLRVE